MMALTFVSPVFGIIVTGIFGFQEAVVDGPFYFWFVTYGLTQVAILAGFAQQACSDESHTAA